MTEGPERKGLDLASVLALRCFAGSRVVAGESGLHRRVSRLNVMEVPDIVSWVKPDELLLTTGYPLRQRLDTLDQLVADLADAGLAGIAVKLGRYVDALPPAMLREADRRGLPIIELTANIAFDEIMNPVLEAVLESQAALLTRGEEAHRALVEIVLAGGDVDLLCEGLVRLLGGAVLVTAVAGDIVASAGDAVLLERARDLACFDGVGRFDPGRGGARNLGSADLQLATERIIAGGSARGHLISVTEGPRPLGEDQYVLERAATVAALAITKAEAVQAVDAKYRSDFLRDVLIGRAGSEQRTLTHAHSLGWDLRRTLVVVVAEVDVLGERALATEERRDLDNRLTRAWTRAVRGLDRAAPAAGFSDEVIALIPVPYDADRTCVEQVVARVAAVARSDWTVSLPGTFSVGISRAVEHVEDLPQAYEHARRALAVGRKLRGNGAVMAFDGLGVLRLLTLIEDPEELTSFARESLGRLVTEPSGENTDLLRSLAVLLECGLNVAEAARKLHYHYNTLRYRLNKLESILGPFTTDAQLRLRVELALQVLELRGL